MAGNILAAERMKQLQDKLKVSISDSCKILLTDRNLVRNVHICRARSELTVQLCQPLGTMTMASSHGITYTQSPTVLHGVISSSEQYNILQGSPDARFLVSKRHSSFSTTERGLLNASSAVKLVLKTVLTDNIDQFEFNNSILHGIYVWDPERCCVVPLYGFHQLLDMIEHDLEVTAKAHVWDGSMGSFEEPEGKSLRRIIRD